MEAGRSESGRFALNDERVGMLYGNHIDLAAEAIGNKARELLESLPQEQRSFRLKSVSPEHWWMI